MIEEIEVKSALNRLHSNYLPYNWDLNVYRGCSHRCQYCYALYSHGYLEKNNFYETILVKKNIVEVLEKQLSSKKWKREIVNLGGVTDSYQPIESNYKLMPEILKLFIKYKTPITISTKSDLILRDKELLIELAKVTMVNVAVTVTTIDNSMQQKLEPGAVSSKRRFEVLKELKEHNIGLGLHFMPILPYLTDNRENIDGVFSEAAKVPVDYCICGMVNLKSQTKINYIEFLRNNFPELVEKYANIFNGAFLKKEYSKEIYKVIHDLRNKYGINSDYNKYLPKNSKADQLELI